MYYLLIVLLILSNQVVFASESKSSSCSKSLIVSLDQKKKDIQQKLELGITLFKQLKIDRAVPILDSIIEQNIHEEARQHASLLLARVFAFDKEPDFDLAREYLKIAMKNKGEIGLEAMEVLKFINNKLVIVAEEAEMYEESI